MKNISLILNIVLLLAVAYLYIDKFSGKERKHSTDQSQIQSTDSTALGPKMVYINADTLLEKYELFREQTEALEKRKKEADASLKARGRSIEKEAMDLAQKAQSGNMTRKELEDEDRRLGEKQQRLLMDQEKIAGELLQVSDQLNDALQAALKEKLDSLKTEMGYDFIISYGVGSPVLAVNPAYDITERVLEMLNKKEPQK